MNEPQSMGCIFLAAVFGSSYRYNQFIISFLCILASHRLIAQTYCIVILLSVRIEFLFLMVSVKVSSKQLKGGKESKMDVLVMENLLFGRKLARLYDLKGSARSRYNPDSSGSNKVLLDQNLIESMPTSPIFVGNKAKRLLERAVWNDTAFLAVSLRHCS